MKEKVKGYKAFDKNMQCKGMQYKTNKIFKMDDYPVCCSKGFHFCENPLDTLNYYDLCDSRFAEVEALGEIDKEKRLNDTKIATNKIKIGAELDLKGFIKASFDFLWSKCKPNDREVNDDKLASSGDYSKQASSGNYSQLVSFGDYCQQASSGNYSQLASSGDNSKLASSGDNSKLASSGDNSKQASSGNYSQLASSGDNSKLASSGDNSKLASSGYNSQLASSGDYSQQASSGDNSKLASSGNYSQQASSGDNSQLASSGNYSQQASSGDNSQLASSGDYSKQASSGNYSQLVSFGDYCQQASSGYYSSVAHEKGLPSVVCNIGIYGKAKGKKGDFLVLAEYEEKDLNKYKTYVYKPICVKSVKIDGKKIKEDTYYKLKNKEFVEVEDD